MEHTLNEEIDWKAKAEENLSGWKRALADYQNLKKETDQGRVATMVLAMKMTIIPLLSFKDNFEKALTYVPKESQESDWYKGLMMALKQLDDMLATMRVMKVSTVGNPFNPEHSEAVGNEHDTDKEENMVLKEVEAGYMMHDTLLRPAKVIVNIVKNI